MKMNALGCQKNKAKTNPIPAKPIMAIKTGLKMLHFYEFLFKTHPFLQIFAHFARVFMRFWSCPKKPKGWKLKTLSPFLLLLSLFQELPTFRKIGLTFALLYISPSSQGKILWLFLQAPGR